MAYVQVELGSLVSLDGEGKQIVIRGRFQMVRERLVSLASLHHSASNLPRYSLGAD